MSESSSDIADIRRVRLFGIPFSSITFAELCAHVDRMIERRETGFIATPNVDHVCIYQRNREFREAYAKARLLLCDGTPLIWASRLLGKGIPEKLSGSDLVATLAQHAAEKGHSLFLFGAADGVAQAAADRLVRDFPAIKIAGVYSPPWGFHTQPEQNAEAIRILRESNADMCYVALGAPKQELWMHRHGEETGIPVLFGIGGSLDFLAGRIRRAPRWMQDWGLEWLWRLCQEPRRLWRRYLIDDMYIFVLFGRELAERFSRVKSRTAT